MSFNTDMLTLGTDYDYVTRTSLNQGVLKTTGFVNSENINEPHMWSLGLLQMDFFYRRKPWYAGQFVRKIIPKIEIPQNAILYFSTVLNKLKPILLSVLVRNVDDTFKNCVVKLPVTKYGDIDFDFMENFIAELQAERVVELSAYLKASGLVNCELSSEETKIIKNFDALKFEKFNVIDIFNVKNTFNILSRDVVAGNGITPYLCASANNNSISSYITYDERYLEKGNCIFIGGKTFVVSYQKKDFYSNDSHNLALYLKGMEITKENQLYLITCIYKSLCSKYSWGNSISKSKIKLDEVWLPAVNGKPDFSSMDMFISAIQKLVIQDVVDFSERKIDGLKQSVSKI